MVVSRQQGFQVVQAAHGAQVAEGALNGIGRLVVPGVAILISGLTKYILNVVFIPIYGEVVVPITTIIYHLVNCLIVTIVLYKSLKTIPDFKNIIIKPLIASLFMGLIVYITYSLLTNIIESALITMTICIIIGAICYFVSLLALKVLTEDEKKSIPFLNKLFSKI